MRSGSAGDSEAPMHELLAAALAGNPATAGFDVHYQPIVRFDDHATAAVEAFPRWNHPVAGRIPSSEFIAVAERGGLVGVLDDFVLGRACADAEALAAAYGHEVSVHVNVSGTRLGRRDLGAAIAWVLKRHKLAPGRLTIEVPAAATLDDAAAAGAAIQQLRDLGVQVALDHFASSLGGLAQLQGLPVDLIKLGVTLTNADADFWQTEDLCQSVVNFSRRIGAVVIADGVETDSQAHVLHTMGCHMGQGRLFGAPGRLAPSANRRSGDASCQPGVR
jgi:diguanylate cyclase